MSGRSRPSEPQGPAAVMPAESGHPGVKGRRPAAVVWIPAFAGMTNLLPLNHTLSERAATVK